MKIYSTLIAFILFLYSCKEKTNDSKPGNINIDNKISGLDISPILDSLDSARISVIPTLPAIEEVDINSNRVKADRYLLAMSRYYNRDNPSYKFEPIRGVSIEQLDADYEAACIFMEKERRKKEESAKSNANKLFSN
jgi:hypothetical protein